MSSQTTPPILLTRSYGFGLGVFALLFGAWLHINSNSYTVGHARLDDSHNFNWWIGLTRGGVNCGWGMNYVWFGRERERSLTGISTSREWDPMLWYDGEFATPTSPLTRLQVPLWPLPALWAVMFASGMYRLHRRSGSEPFRPEGLTPTPPSSPRPQPGPLR
jgi:hypothetical protein